MLWTSCSVSPSFVCGQSESCKLWARLSRLRERERESALCAQRLVCCPGLIDIQAVCILRSLHGFQQGEQNIDTLCNKCLQSMWWQTSGLSLACVIYSIIYWVCICICDGCPLGPQLGLTRGPAKLKAHVARAWTKEPDTVARACDRLPCSVRKGVSALFLRAASGEKSWALFKRSVSWIFYYFWPVSIIDQWSRA